jgi:hypothetical protein
MPINKLSQKMNYDAKINIVGKSFGLFSINTLKEICIILR